MHDRASRRRSAHPVTFRPSRRQFLAGGTAFALLAACGGDDSDSTRTESTAEVNPDEWSVVRYFGGFFAAGSAARIPFGLADTDGVLPPDLTPAQVSVGVRNPDGQFILEDASASSYYDGLPRPYFAFEVTPEDPGFYDMVLDVGGTEIVSQFQVVAPDDPTIASRVDPGEQFPKVQTPTVDKGMGITPICTRNPPCDLHAESMDQLVGKQPTALIISTPAFCQVAVCGPVLDLLLATVKDYPDVAFVHAEVYKNPSENSSPPKPDELAPIMGQTGLLYEPALYTIAADGKVVDRLDYIFGEKEIRDQLDALA